MRSRIQILCVALLVVVIAGCSQSTQNRLSSEQVRELANAFNNRGLYEQAVDEYEQYLGYANLDPASRANLYFAIADIYFERLQDYSNAMAWYMRLKHLAPESQLVDDANKQIIACLERLDRPADANQALKEAASLTPEQVPESRPGEVVARIGERTITTGDLDHMLRQQVDRMPAEMRPQKITRDLRMQVLRQYLLVELLYNTAKRRNLDRDKQIVADVFEMKKMLMANRVQQEEIAENVRVTAADVELFYEKHKDEFAEKDEDGKVVKERTLTEVQEQVARAVEMEKTQAALDELLDRLVQAEDVALFEDKIQ
jgi:tetratricopeptide (TPR) repeat protein